MSKYYKAEDVIRKRAEDLADTSYWEWGNPKNVDEWIEVAEMEFKDLPTIEIVRCKDCEYFKLHESVFGKGWICKRNHVVVGSVDFCSYGERKDYE